MRQYRAALDWIQQQWNEPSRTDHYLMHLIAEVRRSYVKEAGKVKASDMRIQFIFAKQEDQPPVDPKAAVKMSKSIWLGRMQTAGVKVETAKVRE